LDEGLYAQHHRMTRLGVLHSYISLYANGFKSLFRLDDIA